MTLYFYLAWFIMPIIAQTTRNSPSTSPFIDDIYVKSTNCGQIQAGILQSDLSDYLRFVVMQNQ